MRATGRLITAMRLITVRSCPTSFFSSSSFPFFFSFFTRLMTRGKSCRPDFDLSRRGEGGGGSDLQNRKYYIHRVIILYSQAGSFDQRAGSPCILLSPPSFLPSFSSQARVRIARAVIAVGAKVRKGGVRRRDACRVSDARRTPSPPPSFPSTAPG